MMPLMQDVPGSCQTLAIAPSHAHYVNGHSREGEHFLLIFQPKSGAMCAEGPLWCLPWRAPGPPAPRVSGAGRRIARRRSPARRPRRSACLATTASAWRPSRRASESRLRRCTATTRASTNCSATRCSIWVSNWLTARHSPTTRTAIPRCPCAGSSRRSSTPRWPTASRAASTAGRVDICGATTRPR